MMDSFNKNESLTVSNSEDRYVSKLSMEGDIFYALGLIAIVLVSLIVNSLGAALFWQRRKKLSPVELILLNVCIYSIISSGRTTIVIVSALNHEWILSATACKLYSASSCFFAMVNSLSLSSIAVVRYIQICRSLNGSVCNYKQICFIALPAIYLTAAVLAIIPLFTDNWFAKYARGPFGFHCTMPWHKGPLSYISTLYTITTGLPGAVMICCYILIARKTIEAGKTSLGERSVMRKSSVTLLIVYMTVAYLVSHIPYGLLFIFKAVTGSIPSSDLVKVFPTILAHSSYVTTPLIYIMLNKNYRRNLKVLIGCNSNTGLLNAQVS